MKDLEGFFEAQRILIVDESSASRIAIGRALFDLGTLSSAITFAASFESARELISKTVFTGLFCEYDLGKNRGVELFELMPPVQISGIVTKNRSEIAAAEAAEHDVDVFVRKPFTIQSLKSELARAVDLKKKRQANRSAAIEQMIEQAQSNRARANEYDTIGYRSLLGLYDALMAQGKKADAYKILRRLVLNFPVNPQRLMQVLRLAIETQHLGEIEDYYAPFTRVEEKTAEMVNHVSAALILSGRYLLQNGEVNRGVDLFKKTVLASGRRHAFLKKIIVTLVEADLANEADWFLTQFSFDQRETLEFLALDYLVLSRLKPLHEVLRRGRALLRDGHEDPIIYRVLIQASRQAGHFAEAEAFAMDAARRWPSESREYEALLG